MLPLASALVLCVASSAPSQHLLDGPLSEASGASTDAPTFAQPVMRRGFDATWLFGGMAAASLLGGEIGTVAAWATHADLRLAGVVGAAGLGVGILVGSLAAYGFRAAQAAVLGMGGTALTALAFAAAFAIVIGGVVLAIASSGGLGCGGC